VITRRSVALLLIAAPLAGQGVRTRLAERVPAAALGAVDSIVVAAGREGLPTEPLIQKAFEGGAKGATADRIVAAVAASADQLRNARTLLRSAGEANPADPAEMTAVAAALDRGVSPPLVAQLSEALPGEPTGPALHAVADLVGHGFDEDSAVNLVVLAAQDGLRGLRLLDVAGAAVAELQRGAGHATAIARVRSRLPDIPLPPKPAPAEVSRARRVPSSSERP
jgi:uncharacterized protein (DUF2267 family)